MTDKHMTTTDIDQVVRMADAVKVPAYQWDGNKFVHLGGPEITNINHSTFNEGNSK